MLIKRCWYHCYSYHSMWRYHCYAFYVQWANFIITILYLSLAKKLQLTFSWDGREFLTTMTSTADTLKLKNCLQLQKKTLHMSYQHTLPSTAYQKHQQIKLLLSPQLLLSATFHFTHDYKPIPTTNNKTTIIIATKTSSKNKCCDKNAGQAAISFQYLISNNFML